MELLWMMAIQALSKLAVAPKIPKNQLLDGLTILSMDSPVLVGYVIITIEDFVERCRDLM